MIDRIRPGTDVRLAWLLAGVFAFGAYAGVVAPAEMRVRTIAFRAHDLYEVANRNEQLLASAAALRAARNRVERDLASLSATNGSGKATLAALRLLASEAAQHHLVVAGLSPGERSGARGAGSGSDEVTITLQGRYRDVIDAMGDLSRHAVLLELHDVGMAAAAGSAGDPTVDATLRATLYHRSDAIASKKEEDRVQTVIR